MKAKLLTQIALVSLLAMSAIVTRADVEETQIAILHSNVSLSEKWKACQELRLIGTEKAVPEVAILLTDPNLSQAARQTLEALPFPEVDGALADALGKTSGLVKAGIIDSIGWRGKLAAAPLLTPLLSDSDSNVVAAAATSLSRLGGAEAVAALSGARDQTTAQPAILAALIQCAEHLTANNDSAGAIAIYRPLYDDKYPLGIRTAAWRGLVLSGAPDQGELMEKALAGTDHRLQLVAMAVLRQSNDPRLVQACEGHWTSFPGEAQLAVLAAAVKQGNDALPLVRTASQSTLPELRIAAWTAMGDLNDTADITTLAQAAAASKGAEREAARLSLARISGPNGLDALLGEMDHATGGAKAELLLALGGQKDSKATKVLLQNADSSDEAIRSAALQGLRELAPPEALSPLLETAQKTGSDDVRADVLDALSGVCQAYPNKDAASRAVVEAEGKVPPAQKAAFLPLLGDLGTADALATVEAESKNQDLDLAKAAVRALAQWANPGPADALLDLSQSATDPNLRTLALRGAITVSATETNGARRVAILERALAESNQPDEKKLALSQLGQVYTPEALQLALKSISDPAVLNEASLAAVDIAEKLAKKNPQLAQQAATKILQVNHEEAIFKRAWALRRKPGKNVPFIRDWVMCGPFSRQGVVGAIALFNLPFGPEAHDQQVEWRDVPSGDHVDLLGLFPGAENCVAYLRTTVNSPKDCDAVLLMGSDDGIKVWLNGAVVYGNNIDRNLAVDSDAAPIKLKQGANELVLKITQGGGGWAACARIAGFDGKAIAGLQVQHSSGPVGDLSKTE